MPHRFRPAVEPPDLAELQRENARLRARLQQLEARAAAPAADRPEPAGARTGAAAPEGAPQSSALERLTLELTNAACDLVAAVDATGTLHYLNRSGRRLLGLPDDEPLGDRCLIDWLAEDDRADAAAALRSAAQGEACGWSTWAIASADGRAAIPLDLRWFGPYALGDRPLAGLVGRDARARLRREAALQLSEQRFQRVVDNIPQAIFWKDPQSVYQGCNRIFARAAGVDSPAAIVGKTDDDLPWTPEEAAAFRARDRRIVRSGEAELNYVETRHQADGSVVHLEANKLPLRDRAGRIVGILGTYQDATERIRAERELRQSRQMLQTILDTVPEAVVWKDRQSVFLGCNRAAARDLGTTPEAIVGKTDFDLPGTRDRAERYRDDDRRVMASGQPKLNVIEPLALEDGRDIWLETSKVPLRDADGQIFGLVATYRDITDRREAERLLRDRERRLRWLFEQSPLAAIEWSADFRVVAWNRAAETLFGYAADAAIGRSCDELGIVPDRLRAEIARGVLADSGAHSRVAPHRTRDGREIVCEWHNIGLRDDGGRSIGILSKVQDVTERERSRALLWEQKQALEAAVEALKRTQTQLVQSEKMSSLGQMVAGVAHEINNPANFIYGNLSYVREYASDLLRLLAAYGQRLPDPDPELAATIAEVDLDFLRMDLPKLVDSMQVGIDRIRDIVLSLRNFSRLDEADLKKADLREGLDSTLTILNNRLHPPGDRPGIRVAKEYGGEPGDLPSVLCYPGLLNQAFLNLIANAIDALEMADPPPADPCIVLRVAIDADRAIVTVADNGPGIPPEIRDRLFDPFFTTKPAGKGTGLGLSIAYQIAVDRHGGSLRCESEPGRGTTFILEIPRRLTSDLGDSSAETPGDRDPEIPANP